MNSEGEIKYKSIRIRIEQNATIALKFYTINR